MNSVFPRGPDITHVSVDGSGRLTLIWSDGHTSPPTAALELAVVSRHRARVIATRIFTKRKGRNG
jgi:hypothetical protein